MKYHILLKTFLLLILFFAISCKDKKMDEPPRGEQGTATEAMRWIENTMRKEYLWNNEISNSLNYMQEIPKFFTSLLSNKDGNTKNEVPYHYSYIEPVEETKAIKEKSSYGFEFIPYNMNGRMFYRVLYVLPGSPAANPISTQKLNRGDWIKTVTVNGDKHWVKNSEELQSGAGISLEIIRFTHNGTAITGEVHVKDVELGASTMVENNPLLMSKLFYENGQKIGYLVYNFYHEPASKYDEQMKQIFANFKAQGVRKLILDLRYNGGGYVSTLNLQSSLIYAREPNAILCRLVNNRNEAETYTFQSYQEAVDIDELIVLTTELTASASEAIINCLKPYLPVYVIGDRTEGKNVASREFKDDRYPWIMHPIFAFVENKNGQSDYGTRGIMPDKVIEELYDIDNLQFLELGNPQEPLLRAALAHINGGGSARTSDTKTVSKIPNALILTPSFTDQFKNGLIVTSFDN